MQFIEQSPTCFQAVENIKTMLSEAGAISLSEKEIWSLEKGKTYYVTRNDSSVIAFAVPKDHVTGMDIYAAHSDSPCFKIKENPELKGEGEMVSLNVEKYGGMILSTWMDRPVSVAGRVVIENEAGELETRLVHLKDATFVIPNVAIHMNREMNKGVEYNVQKDMAPIFSVGNTEGLLVDLVAEHVGCDKERILGKDLYLYSKMPGMLAGANETLIMGPRLDDLECAYAGVKAFIHCMEAYSNRMRMVAIFDNEEVGSSTKQGAGSTFLNDVIHRIAVDMKLEEQEVLCMLSNSVMVSADNAHGVHPNHPEKADPTNRPYLNQGVVIKYHGSQNYTTDAWSEAWFKRYCKSAGVSVQTYCNRSDIAGGSTLGRIAAGNLSIPMIDIGLAQWAMHSACETAGAKDLTDLIKIMEQIWS